jgi:hypothetical protein
MITLMAGNGTYLSREAILGASDLEFADVLVPEWGGIIRLRTMTAEEWEHYESELADARKSGDYLNIRASLVARCAVDGDGNRLFTDADAQALGRKSKTALLRLFETARKLNAFGDDETKALEKNSEAQPGADSLSG